MSTREAVTPAPTALRGATRAIRNHVVQAGAFSAFLNLLYLAPALYMLQVYDRVVASRSETTLLMLTIILALAVFTIAALDTIRTRLLVRAGLRLDRTLSNHILDAMLRTGRPNAPRSSALLREFDVLKSTLTGSGVLALFDAPWAPIYILVCFLLHPALGFLALAGALLLVVVTWLNERATGKAIKEVNARMNQAYGSVDSSLQQAGLIRALGMRNAFIVRHLRERQDVLGDTAGANFTTSRYTSLVKASRLLLQSLALGLGAWLAIHQQISAGAIFAASLLVSRALAPIELIIGAWKNIVQSRAAYRSIAELLSDAGENKARMALPAPKGELDVQALTVVTPQRNRALINNVSFRLEAGELMGVVGLSGAGKSTLGRALVGAEPTYHGAVRLDGARLEDWPEQQLGDAIGYAPQETSLFAGTVRENIARFRTELAAPAEIDAAVIEAAELCGAHEFILRLPEAYETRLGPNGVGLSVGQAHRIALARALYGRPALVVLDEPNACLDADGEARLIEGLAKLRERGTTVVVIAHRMGVLQNADKILVLRDGRVERFGGRETVFAAITGKPVAAPVEKVTG